MKQKFITLFLLLTGLNPIAGWTSVYNNKETLTNSSETGPDNFLLDKTVKEAFMFRHLAKSQPNTLHIFTHGKPGALLWEGKWVGKEAIVSLLAKKIKASGLNINHINIYGCEFAKGQEGKAALAYLQQHLNITFSASDDITGKDGDWELEAGEFVAIKGVERYNDNLQYAPTDDFDGDGIINQNDLDDDNDGILDTVEENCSIVTSNKTGIIVTKPATINYSTSGTLANLVDGADGTNIVIYNPTGTLTNSEWFRIELPVAKALTYWEIGHYTGQTLFSTASLYKVQGSNNGTTWTDLTGSLTYSHTQAGLSTQANNSNVANFPTNITAYKYYRYFGLGTAAAGTGWATEFYFKELNCVADTDGDGILNWFDLDSDGDGCADAIEGGAGFSNAQLVNATVSGGNTGTTYTGYAGPVTRNLGNTVNSNGIPTIAAGGQTIGTSQIKSQDLNGDHIGDGCQDADGDGISDLNDLDDDNDGILDKVECPYLFTNMAANGGFSVAAASLPNWYMGLASANLPTTDPFTPSVINITNNGVVYNYGIGGGNQVNSPLTGGLFAQYDGVNTATGIQYVLQEQDPLRPVVCKLPVPLVAGANYNYAFDLGLRTTSGSSTTKYFVLLYNADTKKPEKMLNTGALNTLPGTADIPSYKNFSGSFTPASSANYFLLFYPTIVGGAGDDFVIDRVVVAGTSASTCDTDGDGIPNYLDLDSDGDGCPDLKEAGVSPRTDVITPASGAGLGMANPVNAQLNPAAADVNNDGLNDSVDPDLNGAPNYTATYAMAINPAAMSCIFYPRDTASYTTPKDSALKVCIDTTQLTHPAIRQVQICGNPVHGNITTYPDSVCYKYTPATGFTGHDTMCVVICDNMGNCDTTIVRVLVKGHTVAVNDTASTPMGMPVSGNLAANDTCGNAPCSYNTTPLTPPSHGVVTINTNGTYTYTPNSGFVGNDTFAYIVCDAENDCDTALQVISITIPVPLTWLSFTAMARQQQVLLEWSTINEQNNKGFTIERSADGKVWTTISNVHSKASGTNNINILNYSATDQEPMPGKNYYRLLQTDYDNQTSASEVRMVQFSGVGDISISPNPVHEQLNITGLKGNEMLSIYDVSGKKVFHTKVTQTALKVKTSGWANGLYFIHISDIGGNFSAYKILKTE